MATIRLLLICGVVSVALMFFFIRWRNRTKTKSPRRLRKDGPLFEDDEDTEDGEGEYSGDAYARGEAEDEGEQEPRQTSEEKGFGRREPFISTDESGDSNRDENRDKSRDSIAPPDDTNVISITLRARRREGFSGNNLESIFHRFNLTFGAMDIYHRQIRVGSKMDTTFSVLNGNEPGTLKPNDLEEGTSAIIFFIQTQNCHNPLRSFGEMVDVAQQFAYSLDGLLYDDLGSDLTEQTLGFYRNRIREQMLAKRVEQAQAAKTQSRNAPG